MRGTVWLNVQCHFISLPSGQLMPHIGLPLPTHLTNFHFSLFHPTYCKKARKTRGYSSPFWDAPNLSTRKSIASLNMSQRHFVSGQRRLFDPVCISWILFVHVIYLLMHRARGQCLSPIEKWSGDLSLIQPWGDPKFISQSAPGPSRKYALEKLLKIIRHNLRSANRWSLSEGLEPPQLYIRKLP